MKMRVAIITHEFPPFIFGGIGVFTQNLAEALTKQGLDVLVIAGSPDKLPKRKIMGGMEVVSVPRGSFPPRHLWFQLRNIDTIRRELAGCDIVHGQDCAAFPLLDLCKKSGLSVPWVITFHTNPFAELRLTLMSVRRGGSLTDIATYLLGFPLWDITVRRHLEFADHLVSVSASLREEICNAYRVEKQKINVVHTCVNVAHFQGMGRHQRDVSSPTKVNLLYAGRLYYRKGIVHLLRIILELVRHLNVSNFHLQIFGAGPLDRFLRRYIADNHLSTLVTMRGHVPRETLLANLANSDIVCIPSLYEACPVLMIEAMAAGKPVVAFDLPFAREILGEDCSMLLASGGLDSFARILAHLIDSEEDRRKLGLLLKCKSLDFDSEKIASSYRMIYSNLVG